MSCFLTRSGLCRSIRFLAVLLTPWALPSTALAQADPAIVGAYSATLPTPFRAIHAHMLPTGKVMFWDSYDNADHAQLWDPATGSFTPAAQAGYNIFCSGFSFLPDGKLLVTGGHIADYVGLSNASLYDPFANTWQPLPAMSDGRWYPTNTALPNGDALVVSGQTDNTVGMNPLPQVFQAGSGTWRNLTGATLVLPFYPYMYAAPNGKVFAAGPDSKSRYLDTTGSGAWTFFADNRYGSRTWGSSAMYQSGKVMVSGGSGCAAYDYSCGLTPTNTAEIIDLNAAVPAWTYAAPMMYPRKQHNTTILPDGTLLVTGGSAGSEGPAATTLTSPVYPAELWNPTTNQWATLASLTVARAYHAVALLLPDGRVFSAGGNYDSSYEVFSPPYLFKGARPRIRSAPATVTRGQTAFIGTPDAKTISKVAMLALGTVTHTFNAGQRINFLTFSQGSGGINVTFPSNANLAPPGYYMFFLLNKSGVPSVASIVRVGA
jgi:galactose oxidase